MKIIVPMAGMGKRMRPHTLTVPKPLLPIAGKPTVQRLVEDIAKVCNEKIEEVNFIIGRFGAEAEANLIKVAESIGAKGKISYQDQALGTAHAILCAKESLKGKVIVAFADTLFKADFKLDEGNDGTIWVQKIEDPRMFGVVKVNANNIITDFVEKPEEFVSDLAIIGIYYFRDGEYLNRELQYLLDNNIMEKGEYQLTNALENMKQQGAKFIPGRISEWLDCGNKDSSVFTNQRYLEYIKTEKLVADSAKIIDSVIIPPCYIGEQVELKNAVVGPHVSIGNNSSVHNSVVRNSIIQTNAKLNHALIENSMLGNYSVYQGKAADLSVGDYTVIKG
ncbi:MAG TPA: sugar phosphate nucleotidyltransferase [Bacteroidia bacterium]|nr:sugar phosphate nucleotidyltransferase [Bacteroidia bacterium]